MGDIDGVSNDNTQTNTSHSKKTRRKYSPTAGISTHGRSTSSQSRSHGVRNTRSPSPQPGPSGNSNIQGSSAPPGFTDSDDDDSDDDGDNPLFTIKKVNEQVSRRLGMEEYTFKADFDHEKLKDKKLLDLSTQLRRMFDKMLEESGRNYNDDDMARLSIQHRNLDRDIVVHLRSKNNVTGQVVLDR